MKYSVIIAIIIMGISGLLAQTLLVRELLVVFSGNEVSIGIIFANWLILEAIGCFFTTKKVEKTAKAIETFLLFTIFFCLFLFITIFAIRMLKILLGVSIGENIGFIPMFFSSFLILLPVSFTHGALFPLCCRIYTQFDLKNSMIVGKVYIYETAGTMLGGIVSTYFLFPYLNTFQIISYLTLINLITCLILLAHTQKAKMISKIWIPMLGGLALSTVCLIAFDGFERLHFISIKKQFRNQNVVHYENSLYANFCVLENEGQYIFFMDGVPELIVPVPDLEFVEEFAHLPLLAHAEPKNILIISGGAGGLLNEILKHQSVEEIDYIELDPLLLNLLKKFSTPLTEKELNDKRVIVRYTDGRFFLTHATKKYDLIFSGITEPSTLQTNRFFTKEFFSLVRLRLKPGGIFIFGLPGSLNYTGDELRNLNSCIFNTLKSIFPFVRVFPGGINLFLASETTEILTIEKDKIIERLKLRNIKSTGTLPWYIEQKLHPGWQNWFIDFVQNGSKEHNSDFKPIGLFYNISYWVSLFEPKLNGVFRALRQINLKTIIFSTALLLIIFISLRLLRILTPISGIPLTILTTGFSGIIFDLMLIFAFQSIYGYIYSWIGILVAFFMAGSTCGALIITTSLNRIQNHLKLLRVIDLVIILFSISMTLIFLQKLALFPRMLFLILAFVSGFLTGSQFPLASAIYHARDISLVRSGGLFYASDLLGGWLGGIIGVFALLPVVGLVGTGITLILVKLVSFIIMSINN
ncbi:MAG: fused MFS/spermidine synthase [candidate division WOR-3 bacterium]|nr:fused MFS/spermidine synthase [candidate division WOR-3 bacterium]